MVWRIPLYARDMCASRGMNENLPSLKIKQPEQLVWKSCDFFWLTPPAKNIFYKIILLRWRDAVFTVVRGGHWRTFLLIGSSLYDA